MSKLAKNTAYLTAASVGQKFIAFVYFALIARIVGTEWTGKYFLALSVTTMVGVIADFGLTPVLVRQGAKYPDRQQNLLSNILGAKIILMGFAFLAAVIVTHVFGHDALTRQLVYLGAIVMLLDTIHLTFYGILRGQHNLAKESMGIFIGQATTLIIGVTSLLVQPNLHILVIALLGGSLWNVFWSSWAVRRAGLSPWNIALDKSMLKRLFKMALPFAMAAIFVKIYSTTDSLLLNRYLGDESVGLYSIAYKFTYAFQFLPMAFIAALYPTFSRIIGEGKREELHRVFEQAFWYMLILAVPIVFGIWSVGDEVVTLIYGSDFAASILPLKTLVFVLLFIFLDFPIGALLNADDRQATKTAIMGGTMLINVVANILLIPQFGILGACYAALIAFTFLFGAGMVLIRSSLNYHKGKLLKMAVQIFIPGIAMAFCVIMVKQHTHVFLAIPLGAAVYVTGLFLTRAIRPEQLRMIRTLR